nr:diphosphomevalonate decarboxylase [Flavobacteriaceae bacterium]
KEFIRIVETEALTLHSMMMTSNPYFILMKPNTLEVIHQIWDFREQTDIPICFTLDAGANVHILYPKNQKEKVLTFIKNNLVQYCQNGHYILDNVGQGSSII